MLLFHTGIVTGNVRPDRASSGWPTLKLKWKFGSLMEELFEIAGELLEDGALDALIDGLSGLAEIIYDAVSGAYAALKQWWDNLPATVFVEDAGESP